MLLSGSNTSLFIKLLYLMNLPVSDKLPSFLKEPSLTSPLLEKAPIGELVMHVRVFKMNMKCGRFRFIVRVCGYIMFSLRYFCAPHFFRYRFSLTFGI